MEGLDCSILKEIQHGCMGLSIISALQYWRKNKNEQSFTKLFIISQLFSKGGKLKQLLSTEYDEQEINGY